MARDPFFGTGGGADIRDSRIAPFVHEVDGDIVTKDSYQKRFVSRLALDRPRRLLALVSLALFAALFGKLYYLQVLRGAEYYGAAEGNRIQSVGVAPPRGVIMDLRSRRLAYNVPDFALFVTPADLPQTQEEEDRMFSSIAATVGVSAFDLVERFVGVSRDERERVEIMRGISPQAAIVLSKESGTWSGVSVVPVEQRVYALDEPLAHVVGYTGKISQEDYRYVSGAGYALNEHVGKTGIEKAYQSELRGEPGQTLVEVDSSGKPRRELERREAVAGNSVYLHLDASLQERAYDALKESVLKQGSPGGSVVALDPRSGAVRALVSYPSFSATAFARGVREALYEALLADPSKPFLNRATSGEYPSGSTIKLIVGAAALEEGVVNRYTTVSSRGGIRVGEYWYPDWKSGGHGSTDIVRALAESVNTYFYAVGGGYQGIDGLGLARIVSYGRRFGLASPTGIDLPSERSGFLPSQEWKEETTGERWYLGDTYHLAIGQGGVLVTPLQVANFTAVVANKGTLYAPRVVDRIGRDWESAVPVLPVILSSRVASASTFEAIQEGLRAAVLYGTARSLSALPVPIAGKTGTAEFREGKKPHAWFTGYGPYQNPELVVTVLVEEGQGGDLAATPVAKKVFEWYFRDR